MAKKSPLERTPTLGEVAQFDKTVFEVATGFTVGVLQALVANGALSMSDVSAMLDGIEAKAKLGDKEQKQLASQLSLLLVRQARAVFVAPAKGAAH